MLQNTKIAITAGYILLRTLSFANAQELAVDTEADDDPDMILRDYYVIPIKSQADLSFSVGVDYTEGNYGNPDKTKMTYIPVSFRYAYESWSFRISSGYINVIGEDNIIPGTGIANLTNIAENDSALGNDSGMGDVFISGSYSFESLQIDSFFVDITAQAKIPVGSVDKGLSTGKVDLSLQLDMAKHVGNFLPFATLGYRYIGKTERYNLQNTWFVSGGLAYYLNDYTSVGFSYDLRRSATIDIANLQELQAFVDYQISGNWGIYIYAIKGLSDSSPDGGAGFQLRYNY